jgi:hypothetical protein
MIIQVCNLALRNDTMTENEEISGKVRIKLAEK